MWKVADSHRSSAISWERTMGTRESLSDADWLIDDFGKLLDIVSE